MIEPRREEMRRRLLGSVACLCLVVQPLVVPLHLAMETHTYPRHAMVEAEAHSHSAHHHGDHDHGHDHHRDSDRSSRQDRSDSHHPAHSAEDHASDVAKPATSPAPAVVIVLELVPAVAELWDLPTVSRALVPSDAHVPPQRPPKRVASPRAPPVVA